MEMNSNTYDVIVMGGGPAGSSVASILARGRKVVLFEKEQFPRHHIGESLMTDTYFTFQRMGLLEKLRQSPFVRKYSVQFANPQGESRPFYFFEANHHESAVTWQVTRAVFDHMLIDHAAEQGATVIKKPRSNRSSSKATAR